MRTAACLWGLHVPVFTSSDRRTFRCSETIASVLSPHTHNYAQVLEVAERERAVRAASDEAMRKTIDGATTKPVALKPSQIKR